MTLDHGSLVLGFLMGFVFALAVVKAIQSGGGSDDDLWPPAPGQ